MTDLSASYRTRRGELETYFDRTASQTWAKLTSEAPVGSIRATVRAGRDRMRATLLSCLPDDLSGLRLLDAGCGTGALAVEAAKRGADVVAVDLAASLIEIARERSPQSIGRGRIDFRVGDYADPALGRFDYVVAMDSIIHYRKADMIGALERLAAMTERSILFTIAPRTPLLTVMHLAGKLFPKGDRSPRIEPVAPAALGKAAERSDSLRGWAIGRSERIATGFYISQAVELTRLLPSPARGEGDSRAVARHA
jgi:magnesium-protoporphyrin O-methyltransferase